MLPMPRRSGRRASGRKCAPWRSRPRSSRRLLAVHAIRERLKKARTAAVNQLHGLMGEFGIELSKGWRTMLPKAAAELDRADSAVPALLQPQLQRQLKEVRNL